MFRAVLHFNLNGDEMEISLSELANEYLKNAKSLELQIQSAKAKLPSVKSTKLLKDLQRKILVLESMRDEQMIIYYQLRNYYEK